MRGRLPTAARAGLASAGCLLLAVLLGGCRSTPFSSGQQGFVSGGGDVTILPIAKRQPAGEVSGATLDGKQADLAKLKGKVVVLPVWGSWCPPCRAEAPMFEAASEDLSGKGVEFLGINSRDTSIDNARAFARTVGMTYPSIYNPTGSLLLAFHAGTTPNSIPSVLFVDKQGNVAAAVLGKISRTTLYDVVQEIS